MSDLLQLLPIYAFMLIPVWIPLATMAFGAISDAVRTPGRAAVRHRAARTEHRAPEGSAPSASSAPVAA